MIPKTIHYCWFSGDRKPRTIKRCIDSWQRVMPDYKIRCWDSNSFDFDSVPFVRDAMAAKKYAFAADYVRLYALYTEGGIYLDSDVLVKKSFDRFLDNEFFCGTEAFLIDNKVHYRMEAAIMGAEKGNEFVNRCLEYYKQSHFSLDRTTADIVMPAIISGLAQEFGYNNTNREQHCKSGVTVYPTTVFTNTLCPDKSTASHFAIHQNAGSWIDYSNRGWLFRFCKRYGLTKSYKSIENALKRFRNE